VAEGGVKLAAGLEAHHADLRVGARRRVAGKDDLAVRLDGHGARAIGAAEVDGDHLIVAERPGPPTLVTMKSVLPKAFVEPATR
jgi:hypothetical protein